MEAIKKATAAVTKIMGRHPEAQDCDTTLYYLYLTEYGGFRERFGDAACKQFLALMKKSTCSSTLSRARRLVQAGGQLTGNRRVARAEREENIRKTILEV